MMKIIVRFRKLFALLKLVDYVEIDKDLNQITIKCNSNLMIDVDSSIVMRSSKHIVVKAGVNNGLLFLNPNIEESDSVDDITKLSSSDHAKSTEKMNRGDHDDPCSI